MFINFGNSFLKNGFYFKVLIKWQLGSLFEIWLLRKFESLMVHHLKFLIPTAWRLRRPKFEKEIFQIRLKLSHFTILKNRFFCWYLSKFSTKLEIFNHMALYKNIFYGKNESKWLVNKSLGTFVPTCQWYYYFNNFSVIWFWTYFFEKIWKFSNLLVFIFLTCQIPVKKFLVFILNILAQKKIC